MRKTSGYTKKSLRNKPPVLTGHGKFSPKINGIQDTKTITARLTLRRNEKKLNETTTIESKKVENANSRQLFRPDWVSSAECMPHRREQIA